MELAELINLLGDASFPLALLLVSAWVFNKLFPLIQSAIKNQETVLKEIEATQSKIASTLERQTDIILNLERRVSRIEYNLNLRADDREKVNLDINE